MEYNHHQRCEAPICQDDPNPKYKEEVVGYPGDKVCAKAPYQKFQRRQLDINKCVARGKFRNIDVPYTAYELETRSI